MSDENEQSTKREMLADIQVQARLARFDGDERGRWQFATLGVSIVTLALSLVIWLLVLQTAAEVKYLRESVVTK